MQTQRRNWNEQTVSALQMSPARTTRRSRRRASQQFDLSEPQSAQQLDDDTLRKVIEETVAGVFEVDVALLRQPTRGQANIARARQVAMYIAHVACGLTLTEVGHLFDRDRTTVAHACTIVERQREETWFDDAVELLELVVRVLVGPGGARAGPDD